MPFAAPWLLAGVAWAGPLDAPEPEDMKPYRCIERPLGHANNAPLANRTESDQPPGPPTFPSGLESGLVPYAADDVMKKAGKKKGIIVFPSIATLATGGTPITADCENRATDQYDFAYGCTEARTCDVYLTIEGHPVTLGSRPQVASKFTPVDSAKEAIGMVALYEPDLFLPLSPGERDAWARESANYHLVEPVVPWLEVEEQPEGWLVHAPRRVSCGCDRDVVRRTYWISEDGRGCTVDDKPIPLAIAVSPAPDCAQ